MMINSLSLANFRGLKQLELSFATDVTVIAGVNGSGKSAILSAIASSASHMIPKLTPSKEQPISFTKDDIHAGKPSLTVAAKFEINGQRFHTEILRTKQDQTTILEVKKRRDEIRFAIRQTKKKSIDEIELQEELRYIEELLSGDKEHFSFHTEGVDAEEKILEELKQTSNHPLVVLYNTSRYLTKLPPILPKLKPFEPAN